MFNSKSLRTELNSGPMKKYKTILYINQMKYINILYIKIY